MNIDSLTPYMNYIIAVLIVLGALLVVVLLIRAVAGRGSSRRGGRLGVSEYFDLDKSRQLVLVRRDGVEHLLLIGGGEDLVIETNIGEEPTIRSRAYGEEDYEPRRPMFSTVPDDDNASTSDEPREPVLKAVHPAPRPAVFGDNAPNVRPIKRGHDADNF